MVSAFISKIGIQTDELIALLFLIQIFLFVLLISVNMKYKRLKRNYSMFMRGKDGKNLEESILDKFAELYNAFQEMGGNLSFALTMLDEEDSGWVLNAMHSRDACYTYIKEIVKGESYIELAEEEKESLERAIFQEAYDFKDMDLKKLR